MSNVRIIRVALRARVPKKNVFMYQSEKFWLSRDCCTPPPPVRPGRLFEAERLLTFSAFRMGAYSRGALMRVWAFIRINRDSLSMGLGFWIPFLSRIKNFLSWIPRILDVCFWYMTSQTPQYWIHEEQTREIITVTVVWILDLIYHKM